MILYKRNAQGKPIFWEIYKSPTGIIQVHYGLVGKEGHFEQINTHRKIDDEIAAQIKAKRKEGYKELETRLEYLKTTARVDVANKIEVARSFGDISENSEYDAAREEEALVEQEIQQIQNTLRNAKIINKAKVDTNQVSVGSTVVVEDLEFGDDLTFKIMGSFESDPTKGLISNESPIGKALLGAKKGDVVEVATPNSVAKYKVLEIKA